VPDYLARLLARAAEREARRRLGHLFGTAGVEAEPLIEDAPAGEVLYACPECDIGRPAPLCLVCLGAGVVDAQRLDRWVAWVNRGKQGPL